MKARNIKRGVMEISKTEGGFKDRGGKKEGKK